MAECSVTVDSTDQMSYDTKEITVDTSCKEFTIRLTFSGNLPKNVMGHNLVVSKTADMQGIATEGMAQGLEKDYLNKANPNIIAHTAMIGAEEKANLRHLRPLQAGRRRRLLLLLHLPGAHLDDEGQSRREVTTGYTRPGCPLQDGHPGLHFEGQRGES